MESSRRQKQMGQDKWEVTSGVGVYVGGEKEKSLECESAREKEEKRGPQTEKKKKGGVRVTKVYTHLGGNTKDGARGRLRQDKLAGGKREIT